ncbi:Cysteine-rich membrane protein 1 [Spironucleus salmonicida]|uniref:Cysteine-rich membrane protein 1 n=1 Tax=Spironucleus salmonicida TaxID=348837 RepID=V6LD27_9EUKA|nr:Cysteine-rich membrane protein 1 [Spironucleus salmonicida]|eukprot:EST41581.1 Cysteine-rich membrane protein 1 [Spironucleus salmonicida]
MTDSASCTQTTPNCASCDKGACTACIPEYHLSQGLCAPNKQNESPADKSDPTDPAPPAPEEETCTTNKECRDKKLGFCDGTSKTCKPCAAGCKTCTSFKFCAECNNTTSKPTTLITGECAPFCNDNRSHVYCSISGLVNCNRNSTSPCVCNGPQNCAECTRDGSSCQSCLTNMKKGTDGKCSECADGLVMVGKICTKDDVVAGEVPVPPGPDPVVPEPGVNSYRLSGGAVAGIVIGVLLVVGAVGGGLAYYFVRRGKK